jgi:hypothetical protein
MRSRPLQYTGVRQTDDTSRAVLGVARALPPFSDGVLLEVDPTTGGIGYRFTPGQTRTLVHGLGRRYRGFFVVADFGSAGSELASQTGAADDNSIVMTHYGVVSCQVKLWVW